MLTEASERRKVKRRKTAKQEEGPNRGGKRVMNRGGEGVQNETLEVPAGGEIPRSHERTKVLIGLELNQLQPRPHRGEGEDETEGKGEGGKETHLERSLAGGRQGEAGGDGRGTAIRNHREGRREPEESAHLAAELATVIQCQVVLSLVMDEY
ncbi:hypothetical protein GUJ93_ZPchr0013g36919 [Zizania palustris]|uniref:Uncharacterized protein n=1 Tax=Zizania palustris TaxID=103762 RepID=A0A8J5X616_ZIZPA|nr:hypothetical protein GUJ93_ZPchr0013g36919 [Zizania palustris]